MTTFTRTPTSEKGVIHAQGKGVVITMPDGDGGAEPEMITHTDEVIGRLGSSRNVKWCGSLFFRRSSGSKLAFSIIWLEFLKLISMLMGTFQRKHGKENKKEKSEFMKPIPILYHNSVKSDMSIGYVL